MKIHFFILLILFSVVVTAADPTQAEKDFFDELSNRYDLHKDLAPLSVQEARGTINKELKFEFDCDNPPPAKGVIKIRTKLVKWADQSGESGHYDWKCTIKTNGNKELECDNEISIDLDDMLPENSFSKAADNVRIYYHEWLHSQLMINEMKTDNWQDEFCKCNTDLSKVDTGHVVIPGLDQPFEDNLTTRIIRMDDPWNKTGNFSLIIDRDIDTIPEFGLLGLMIVSLLFGILIFRQK